MKKYFKKLFPYLQWFFESTLRNKINQILHFSMIAWLGTKCARRTNHSTTALIKNLHKTQTTVTLTISEAHKSKFTTLDTLQNIFTIQCMHTFESMAIELNKWKAGKSYSRKISYKHFEPQHDFGRGLRFVPPLSTWQFHGNRSCRRPLLREINERSSLGINNNSAANRWTAAAIWSWNDFHTSTKTGVCAHTNASITNFGIIRLKSLCINTAHTLKA